MQNLWRYLVIGWTLITNTFRREEEKLPVVHFDIEDRVEDLGSKMFACMDDLDTKYPGEIWALYAELFVLHRAIKAAKVNAYTDLEGMFKAKLAAIEAEFEVFKADK